MLRWLAGTLLVVTTAQVSMARDDAGSTVNTTLTVTPKSGNGYEAKVPFSYVFRNCYGDLHVNIGKNKNQGIKYLYKGKAYWPGFFGKSEFGSVSVGLVTLYADVIDNGQNKGNMKMYNVTTSTGAGCFGQVYKVGDLISIDGKAAAKRPKDFSLSNIRIEGGGSRDYKLEKLIVAQIKKEEEGQKAAAAPPPAPTATAAKVAGAATKTSSATPAKKATTTKATTTQKTTPQQTTPKGPSDYEKRQKVKKDLDNFQKQQDAKMKAVDRDTKRAAKKVTSAATNFYKGWQGSGTSLGFSMRTTFDAPEEQDPFWLGVTFGSLWDPTNPRTHKKWISGFETEFAFNSDWLGASDLGCAYTCNDSNWDRYNWGFFANFTGNITAFGVFQPYIGIGWVEKQTFDTLSEEVDSGMEFVQDIGIGINLGGAALIKFASNSKMDTFLIGASFMSR